MPDPVQDHSRETRKVAGRARWKWKWVVPAVVLAGFGLWLAQARLGAAGFRWHAFAASFARLDSKWVLAAAAGNLLAFYGRALRWRLLLKPLRPGFSLWELTKATIIGFMAVGLLGRPGELVRPYLIATRAQVPLSSQLAAWFIERLCDLLAVLLIFGFTLFQLGSRGATFGPSLRWALSTGGYVITAVGIVCLVLLVMLSQFAGTVHSRLSDALGVLPAAYARKANRIVAAFLEGSASVKSRRSVLYLAGYTLLEWTIIAAGFFCLFRAYPETAGLPPQSALVFLGFVAFGSLVQIPGVGGGVQIVTVVVLTEVFGLTLEVATSMALLIWFLTFVAVVPPGLALAFHEGLTWRRLRDLKQEAGSLAGEESDS